MAAARWFQLALLRCLYVVVVVVVAAVVVVVVVRVVSWTQHTPGVAASRP
jgi:hypothetical protein